MKLQMRLNIALGAGKTHTMIGNIESGPGVMVQCLRSLYRKIEAQKEQRYISFRKNIRNWQSDLIVHDRSYNVSISYLEVYNETIRDLLIEDSPAFEVREDKKNGVTINGRFTQWWGFQFMYTKIIFLRIDYSRTFFSGGAFWVAWERQP